MALRIHLGMIPDDSWNKLVNVHYNESTGYSSLNQWMKKTYNAVEVTNDDEFFDAGEFRVYEFRDKEKYTEFCLIWL